MSGRAVVRVTGLGAIHVRVPFRRPFATATGMWLHREAWLVRLLAADGRVGLGEAVLEPETGEVAETILRHLLVEAAGEARAGRLPAPEALELHGAPGRALRAALDAALLDLRMAPGDGSPAVASSVGAAIAGAGVPVNGTIAFGGPREGAEAARQAIEAGFTTLKLKAGAERETDALVERIRAIRAAVGPDAHLRLDVNGAWDLPTAEERLEAVARFGIEYAEQPLPADDVAGMAELRRLIRVPVAADEAADSPGAVRALLAADAVDVLVVKPARVGGPAAVVEIAERAARRGVPVVVSTLFETGVGIAAALAAAGALPAVSGARVPGPLAHGLATAGLLEHDLLVAPLVVEDGRMRAPGGPGTGGLGVALDDRAVRRFASDVVGGDG